MQPKLSEDSKSVKEWTETKYTVLSIVWSRINITRKLFLDGKTCTPETIFSYCDFKAAGCCLLSWLIPFTSNFCGNFVKFNQTSICLNCPIRSVSYFWLFVSSVLVLIALHWPFTLRDPNKTWNSLATNPDNCFWWCGDSIYFASTSIMATRKIMLITIWVIVAWTRIISLCCDDGDVVLFKAVVLRNFEGASCISLDSKIHRKCLDVLIWN